jgi:hypothetical protein
LKICSVSAAIDVDRSIFKICGESGVINLAEKTVSDGHPNWVNRNRMSGFSSSW